MTYRIIKSENYDTEIAKVDTIEDAIKAIKDFNSKCKYPLEIAFDVDEKDDGLDAVGTDGRNRLVLFYTVKEDA